MTEATKATVRPIRLIGRINPSYLVLLALLVHLLTL